MARGLSKAPWGLRGDRKFDPDLQTRHRSIDGAGTLRFVPAKAHFSDENSLTSRQLIVLIGSSAEILAFALALPADIRNLVREIRHENMSNGSSARCAGNAWIMS